jgi:hypothetical protein
MLTRYTNFAGTIFLVNVRITNMIKYIVILSCFSLFLYSCKKDEKTSEPETPAPVAQTPGAMQPLAVGNYWIYQKSLDDSIGTYTMQNEFDSVYVEKDSMIMNEHYFKLSHANANFTYYFNFGNSVWIKDSLGYLIHYPHRVLLDTVHLLDTLVSVSYGGGQYGKLVPDTFLNRSFYIGNHSGFWMRQCFLYPAALIHFNGTYCYQAFTKNIGLIRARMLYTGSPYHTLFSYHLIRYHLN